MIQNNVLRHFIIVPTMDLMLDVNHVAEINIAIDPITFAGKDILTLILFEKMIR